MNDDVMKQYMEFMARSMLRVLENRLEQLEDMKKFNGRLDAEILDTRNDIVRYRKMLEEVK